MQTEDSQRLRGMTTPEERNQFLAEVFEQHRRRLRLLVDVRLHSRLRGRIDPSDVLQEAFIEMLERLDEYLTRQPMALFLWMRLITGQKVQQHHRRHLKAKNRDARREVSIDQPMPEATSGVLATRLLANESSPSRLTSREETRKRLSEALDVMEPLDREILALRHFEELRNREVSEALGIDESTTSKRYFRALAKLRTILAGLGIHAPDE